MLGDRFLRMGGQPTAELGEGRAAALRAVQIDEKNPYSHYGLAIVSVASGALAQAVRAAEKAIELSPSYALGYIALGMARLFSGRAAEAVEPLEHGLRLSPFDPQNFVWSNILALAFYFAGQAEHALSVAMKALNVRPSWFTMETVILSLTALGRTEEAQAFVEQMREVEKPSADILAQLKVHNPNWARKMTELLRKAGVREE
jgi:tetratricopeptide (TPR) repeat protein